MNDFLIEHAAANVWCTPSQDRQYIMELSRITPELGLRVSFKLMWQDVSFPNAIDLFHVYQIGGVNSTLLNLELPREKWHLLTDIMVSKKLMADIYQSDGLQIPRFSTYLRYSQNGALIIAIKQQRYFSLRNKALYFRIYSNAYFASEREQVFPKALFTRGFIPATSTEIAVFRAEYQSYKVLTGYAYAYVNGLYVEELSPITTKVGDCVEFIYDSTVKAVLDIKVSELDTFNSSLDSDIKYLIRHNLELGDTIEYRDDVDVWVYSHFEGRVKGAFFHRNQESSIRMVTHLDYSIPSILVDNYATGHPFLSSVENNYLKIVIRHSGWRRALINDSHYIKELYKIPYEDRKHLYLGLDSIIDEWKADSLESAAYPEIMRMQNRTDITLDMVENAYGYNGIAWAIAQSPLRVSYGGSFNSVILPINLQRDSTIFEYDQSGALMGWYQHSDSQYYLPRDTRTVLIEGFTGVGSSAPSVFYGNDPVNVGDHVNFRCYITPNYGAQVFEEWVDVTADPTKYFIDTDGSVVWTVNPASSYGQVRTDERFLCYEFDLTPTDGVFHFSVNAIEVHYGTAAQKVMEMPLGELDVFMNKRLLTPNIDYVVDWPLVVILNKSHMTNTTTQRILVRGYDFCTPEMKLRERTDYGFVSYGQISRNGIHNLKDDRVMQIVANGELLDRERYTFAENEGPLLIHNRFNGKPYHLKSQFVSFREYTNTPSYELRAISEEFDDRVMPVIGQYISELEPVNPSHLMSGKYPLYSPFCNKVLHDMLDGTIPTSLIKGHLNNEDVYALLEDATWLLEYDPCLDSTGVLDPMIVSIHPHHLNVEVAVNHYQWSFLERINALYLNDKLDISRFVTVNLRDAENA